MTTKKKISKKQNKKSSAVAPLIINSEAQFKVLHEYVMRAFRFSSPSDDTDDYPEYTDAIVYLVAMFATIEEIEMFFNLKRVMCNLYGEYTTIDLVEIKKHCDSDIEYRRALIEGMGISLGIEEWKLIHRLLASSRFQNISKDEAA